MVNLIFSVKSPKSLNSLFHFALSKSTSTFKYLTIDLWKLIVLHRNVRTQAAGKTKPRLSRGKPGLAVTAEARRAARRKNVL
ncbi:hypothetical protein [Duganella qianjiadongensis]|uniref:Uncharacterized protein n=1 Tax=Duganella qianjiadongensis TaxID=2692176 RepID=A0ABW9VKF8_9BURK|nr:hypothetical protein [Duganella qianjiadongensis]MYM39202.1 hypothetical protein [Duganella qianjiadongensis]